MSDTGDMVIIAGSLIVTEDERDAAVAAFRDLVRRARQADGCLHIAITADSVDPARIDDVEVWRDAAALEAWRDVADAPAGPDVERMDVERYAARDGGPLF